MKAFYVLAAALSCLVACGPANNSAGNSGTPEVESGGRGSAWLSKSYAAAQEKAMANPDAIMSPMYGINKYYILGNDVIFVPPEFRDQIAACTVKNMDQVVKLEGTVENFKPGSAWSSLLPTIDDIRAGNTAAYTEAKINAGKALQSALNTLGIGCIKENVPTGAYDAAANETQQQVRQAWRCQRGFPGATGCERPGTEATELAEPTVVETVAPSVAPAPSSDDLNAALRAAREAAQAAANKP